MHIGQAPHVGHYISQTLDLASGESRKISGDFDRGISAVRWAGSSNRL